MLCLDFFCKIRSSLMIVVRLGEKSKKTFGHQILLSWEHIFHLILFDGWSCNEIK